MMNDYSDDADSTPSCESKTLPIRATRLRFKSPTRATSDDERRSKRRRLSNEDDAPRDEEQEKHESRHRKHHRRKHSHKDQEHNDPTRARRKAKAAPPEDPDVAFRESLFDAMGDDEGADFWEGVYGQPVHIYENSKPGPDGKLERMTEDEYVDYVRARMWEKTHQHLVEEKKRREKAAHQQREHQQERQRRANKAWEEAARFQKQMDESLKRGEQRRSKNAWQQAFETYAKRWERLHNAAKAGKIPEASAGALPWPVRSGRMEDLSATTVEEFMLKTADLASQEGKATARLKTERVRWHPDKMQQRLGGKLGEKELRAVTAVFQIIDDMWNRNKGG